MYHYTESGLQNVWLTNGYKMHRTEYGRGVAIQDVEKLHHAIGKALACQPRLTGAELRFLRKEMGFSQSALAEFIGTSEQNVSLWERRGRIPKVSDRLVKLLYLEKINGNVKVQELIQRHLAMDQSRHGSMKFVERAGTWKEAA